VDRWWYCWSRIGRRSGKFLYVRTFLHLTQSSMELSLVETRSYRSVVEIYGKEEVDAWVGNGIVGGRDSRSERLDEEEIG